MLLQTVLLTALALTDVLGETIRVDDNGLEQRYSFEVDYTHDQFLLDGRPFRYVSGSFHYFRTPKQYWRDRLQKMRAAGLNAVSTYVEWSLHEPSPNKWHWSGDADLLEFLNIAQQENLLVLLRPGPYICAERDLGGLPYWLLTLVPDIRLRTIDTRYMQYVERYLSVLLNKVEPYLRGNGGPIIMVQVENEYGSYIACDKEYMKKLRDVIKEAIGSKALLYTTDGYTHSALRCGTVSGAYATVDFGVTNNVTNMFIAMRKHQPKGPLVNSEFYPGWLTHWGEPFQRVATRAVAETLDRMLEIGASVNIYMFYGGTNFGFTSGANGGVDQYSPQLTSYDYDAPLTEAGDLTEKYFAIRDVIAKYLPMPNVSIPLPLPKADYGPVLLEPVVGLLNPQAKRVFGTEPVRSLNPLTFEYLNIPHGFLLYETTIPLVNPEPPVLTANVRDRTLVYVRKQLVGELSRTKQIYTLNLSTAVPNDTLSLLVENQGHLNYGNAIHDFKGVSDVTVSDTKLTNWKITGFPLHTINGLDSLYNTGETIQTGQLRRGPAFFRGLFSIADEPRDTYLDTTGWGKGLAFVNGINLGRYWPLEGPQITLYVPAPYLKTGRNELVILELEYAPRTRKMKFQDKPNLNHKI